MSYQQQPYGQPYQQPYQPQPYPYQPYPPQVAQRQRAQRVTVRRASPIEKLLWWTMVLLTCGLWALFVRKPW